MTIEEREKAEKELARQRAELLRLQFAYVDLLLKKVRTSPKERKARGAEIFAALNYHGEIAERLMAELRA